MNITALKETEDTDMYKIILAPLDGSKRAEAILPHLREIARLYQAKVVFLQGD